MKKYIICIIGVLLAGISQISCEKEGEMPVPEVCFSSSANSVGIFEIFAFTNCSGPADYYVIYTGEPGSDYDSIGDTTLVDRKGNLIYQTSRISIPEGGTVEYYYRQPGVYKAVMVASNVSKWGGETVRDTTSILITVQ